MSDDHDDYDDVDMNFKYLQHFPFFEKKKTGKRTCGNKNLNFMTCCIQIWAITNSQTNATGSWDCKHNKGFKSL